MSFNWKITSDITFVLRKLFYLGSVVVSGFMLLQHTAEVHNCTLHHPEEGFIFPGH